MFFRIFPSISVLLVINSLNSLQVNGLLRSDESFVQPIGGMHFTWDLMKSMHTMMKPEISEFERLFGTQFLGQVRFFVYMDGFVQIDTRATLVLFFFEIIKILTNF